MNQSGNETPPSSLNSTLSCRVELGSWPKFQSQASAIRFEVFVQEQQVPLEEELDAIDTHCVHALAFNDLGEAIGTGRLLPDGHIGRMAVLKLSRGNGVGAAILMRLTEEARARGFTQVVLSAQTHARAFYAKYGFKEEGEEYLDANIAHILMRKLL